MSPRIGMIVGFVAVECLAGAGSARNVCAGPAEPSVQASLNLSEVVLTDEKNQALRLDDFVAAHRFTVVVFYAADCPCFAAHIPRLLEIEQAYAGNDVKVLVVDSERHHPPEPGAPTINGGLAGLRDKGGNLARRLDANFATETFVFDSAKRLRYRGGVDSDRNYLNPNRQAYLDNALRSLVSGTAPTYATSKALGCALKLR